jgi:hypothetical protein
MYVCMYVCMYTCMYVCTYACMYVCMYVCMCDVYSVSQYPGEMSHEGKGTIIVYAVGYAQGWASHTERRPWTIDSRINILYHTVYNSVIYGQVQIVPTPGYAVEGYKMNNVFSDEWISSYCVTVLFTTLCYFISNKCSLLWASRIG